MSESQSNEDKSGDWVKVLDATSGKYYYANVNTGKTSWVNPVTPPEPRKDSIGSISSSSPRSPPKMGISNTGEVFDEIFDEKSQTHYYFCRSDRSTSWNKPSGFVYTSEEEVKSGKAMPARRESLRDELDLVPTPRRKKSGHLVDRPNNTTIADTGIPPELADEIHRFRVDGFADSHFRKNTKRVGFFKRSIPVEDVLSFQTVGITSPLLHVTKSKNAIVVFRHILKFMKLEASKKSQGALSKSIIEQGMNFPQLRDEIFCQLVKQTNNNPDRHSLSLAWKLFILVICAFPPTRGFEGYLFSHLSKCSTKNPEHASLIIFATWRLNRTIRSGPMRTLIPMGTLDLIEKDGIPYQYVSFGSSLSLVMKCQKNYGLKNKVPVVLEKLIQACRDTGAIDTEGIFRRTGDKSEIEQVIDAVEQGTLDFVCDDPLVLGDVLKIWFREMVPRIFSVEVTKLAIEVSESPVKYDNVLKQLSEHQYDCLDCLLRFCVEITENASVNSMGPENLGIVFAPNLFTEESNNPSLLFTGSNARINFVTNLVKRWALK